MKGSVWFRPSKKGVLREGKRGTYSARVDVGRKNGMRKQRSKHGFPTKSAANAWVIETLSGIKRRVDVEPSKETVEEFGAAWLEAIKPPAGNLRLGTWQGYRTMWNAYVLPALADVRVQELTAEELDLFFRKLLENGRVKGGGSLSPDTVRHVRVVLGKALTYGVRKGKLLKNVVALTEPVEQEKPTHKVWTPDELRRFLEFIAGDRLFALWHLESVTGLRRSELTGLSWPAVDLDKGRISIRATMAYEGPYSVRLIELTKRDSSRRQIAIDPQTVAILRSWKKRQAEERLAWGEAWSNHNNLVFTREDGSPIHPELVSDWFDALGRKAGLPRITFHELRHTYATLSLQAGIPVKVVSQRLGHSSIKVTFDLYAHVIPSDDEGAAATFTSKVLAAEERH
jgi:integrase